MNPDMWTDDIRGDWHSYLAANHDRFEMERENIHQFYEDDDNFTDKDNEVRFSRRDMNHMKEVMYNQAEEAAEMAMRHVIEDLERELDDTHEDLTKCKQKLLTVSQLEHKISMMEKLLDQYALYSEIEYDKDTFVLIGV